MDDLSIGCRVKCKRLGIPGKVTKFRLKRLRSGEWLAAIIVTPDAVHGMKFIRELHELELNEDTSPASHDSPSRYNTGARAPRGS